jgi:hypothetical protein
MIALVWELTRRLAPIARARVSESSGASAMLFGFFATVLPNFGGYAAALAGYTTAIVFGDLVADPQNVFMQAVWRVTEIAIGILSAELVHALTDFGHARTRLARVLADTGRDIASGLMQTLRTGGDPSELRTLRRTLIRRVIALDQIIDEAVGEPSQCPLGSYKKVRCGRCTLLRAWPMPSCWSQAL